jgi:ferritin-like metal-binding protein YciE
MSGTTTVARETFVVGLRNQHAVEKQAIELLERQLGRLVNYPELEERIRLHIEETKEQAKRLEDLLTGLGTSHSSLKDTVASFIGNLAALAHVPASDEVIKDTLANFAFEHYEIASYKALLVLADASGHDNARTALNQSLHEEEQMAQWIDEHIKPTVLRYLERSEAGQTAGR